MTPSLPNESPREAALSDINSRNRLDDLPPDLCNLLVDFSPLAMRAVLALLPQFRIRPHEVQCARQLLCGWSAEYGYLDLLKWADEHEFPLRQARDGRDVCASAATGGFLEVLQWLRDNGCIWDALTCENAAKHGHLNVMQWALDHGCLCDEEVMSAAAAEGGQLHVLQWLHANGFQWRRRHITLLAAMHGHWKLLEWALANGCLLHSEAAARAIVRSGDLCTVEWALTERISTWPRWGYQARGLTFAVIRLMHERRPDLNASFSKVKCHATRQLARVGDLAGLEWARENGYFDARSVGKGAGEGGVRAVFEWAHKLKLPDDGWDCEQLARKGHLECLKWARENGYKLSAEECAGAARHAHLNVLQWLREVGCEWDGETLHYALSEGHWEVFEWARKNGCPVDCEALFRKAAERGHADVLQWAFENAQTELDPDTDWCAYASDVQVLKVLLDHGCVFWPKTCVSFSQRGDLELLQYAMENGCPKNSYVGDEACVRKDVTVVQWLVENDWPLNERTREWWNEHTRKSSDN